MRTQGVYAMIAFLPLTEFGAWFRIQDPHPDFMNKHGKLVFVPQHHMLMMPVTTLVAGGIRTSPLGNPMLVFSILCRPGRSGCFRTCLDVMPLQFEPQCMVGVGGYNRTLSVYPEETNPALRGFLSPALDFVHQFLGFS